jgi:hypothetical protein
MDWKSFLFGWGSSFDYLRGGGRVSALLSSGSGADQDAEAIAGDWRAVGDALRWAMGQAGSLER